MLIGAIALVAILRSFLPGDSEAKPERKARDSLVVVADSTNHVADSLLLVIDSMIQENRDRKVVLRTRIKTIIDPSIDEVKNQRDSALAGWNTSDSISAKKDTVILLLNGSINNWHAYHTRAESRIKKLERHGPKLLGIPLPEPVISYSTPVNEFKPRLSVGLGYKISLRH